jgi:tripartite ATP-independent transporter DctM subunit
MGLIGIMAYAQVAGWAPALALPGIELPAALSSLDLALIPMFMLMGNLASACNLSADIYRVAIAFTGHRRGGLAMATIATCACFGAVCGSAIATVATMAKVALQPMLRHGYKVELATGSIAAGGSLGVLIPPSVIMVVYAVLTEQLVLPLFVAAIVPSVLAVTLHLLAVAVYVRLFPDAAPVSRRASWRERSSALRQSRAVVTIGLIVTAGIYGGIFTVMEAAAVGVVVTFLFALGRKALNRHSLLQVMSETAASAGMIYIVIIGAWILSYVLAASKLPEIAFLWIQAQSLSPLTVVLMMYGVYLILGCIFDELSALIITLPVVLPIVTHLGYDPIWWGVCMIIVIEIGLIAPPIGINVFILHAMSNNVPLRRIFVGIVPFLVADLLRLLIITLFPSIALWLPRQLGML